MGVIQPVGGGPILAPIPDTHLTTGGGVLLPATQGPPGTLQVAYRGGPVGPSPYPPSPPLEPITGAMLPGQTAQPNPANLTWWDPVNWPRKLGLVR